MAPAVAETAPLVTEFVINPNGKSEVCILHEYMQRVLKVRPVYNFFECGECDLPHLTPKASSTSLGSPPGRRELTVSPLCWVGTRGEVEGDQMVTSPHPLPTVPPRVEGPQPCNGHQLSSGCPHHSSENQKLSVRHRLPASLAHSVCVPPLALLHPSFSDVGPCPPRLPGHALCLLTVPQPHPSASGTPPPGLCLPAAALPPPRLSVSVSRLCMCTYAFNVLASVF